MPSFGEKLKTEREKRKISLEQISSSTKIGTRMLQALEEEKFSQLPGGIFNKGFVRAYARSLGLDEDQAVVDYLEASGEAPTIKADSPNRDSSARPPAFRNNDEGYGRLEIRAEMASRQLPWGIFAVILLIIALGLSLWNYRRRERDRIGHQPKSAMQLSSQRSSVPTSAIPPAAGGSPTSQSQPSGGQQTSAIPNTPERVSTSASHENATTSAQGEFLVVIQARGESWLSPVVDGTPVPTETLRTGDVRSFHVRERFTVKAGNAAALAISENGKPITVTGDSGQVKTITLGPEGIVLPATQ